MFTNTPLAIVDCWIYIQTNYNLLYLECMLLFEFCIFFIFMVLTYFIFYFFILLTGNYDTKGPPPLMLPSNRGSFSFAVV